MSLFHSILETLLSLGMVDDLTRSKSGFSFRTATQDDLDDMNPNSYGGLYGGTSNPFLLSFPTPVSIPKIIGNGREKNMRSKAAAKNP